MLGKGRVGLPKIYIADFGPIYRALERAFGEKMQYNFPKIRGGIKGRLEFFRKFVRFGTATRPLGTVENAYMYRIHPI